MSCQKQCTHLSIRPVHKLFLHMYKKPFRKQKYREVPEYLDEKGATLVWKGIPYAKPPVGDLRWKEPQNLEPLDQPFITKEPGDVCIQSSADGVIGSEDCLYLDIYRPKTDKENLPVLVFIHGGNNQTGQSDEITGGEAFVNDLDVIYVSINYRLGPLGFNPLVALNTGNKLEDSGNYTLLDIAKSLDWINENIEGFGGGDPANVTVAGFSAGGRNVMTMLTSPLFENKFHKAMVFSGGMTMADPEDSRKVFANAIAPLVVEDGKKETEEEAYKWLQTGHEEVKEYLYSLSAERLSELMSGAAIRMSTFPHLYSDGGVVLPKEQFDTTTFIEVPLIMTTGTSEFSMFAMEDPYFTTSLEGNEHTDEEKQAELEFVLKYGSLLYGLFNTQESATRLIDHYNAPIYTLKLPFGDEESITPGLKEYRSFHGVFVPLLDTNNTTMLPMFQEDYQLEGGPEIKRSV